MSFGAFPTCENPILSGPRQNTECGSAVTSCLYFLTLMNTMFKNSKIIKKARKRIHQPKKLLPSYDFVVIGSGNAGAVVAGRLSEVPDWNVLLIEAGPDEPNPAYIPSNYGSYLGTSYDWNFKTQNEKYACLKNNGSCIWPRGKNLGGTTVHHGMAYHRGNSKDYERWVKMGNTEWSWEKVFPYFLKSEDNREISRVGSKHHGIKGPLPVERFPWQPQFAWDILKAGDELGYGTSEDLVGDKITGFTIAQTISENGVRVSSVGSYVRPHRHRKNLHVLYNAVATRIVFNENKEAVGVEYVKHHKIKYANVTREVILSGGAVNSPQLLLLSGVGSEKHLRQHGIKVIHDLPGVGKNFHNHVSYGIKFAINNLNHDKVDEISPLQQYLSQQNGPMSATGLGQVTAILASNYTTKDDPDIQLFFSGYLAGCKSKDTRKTRYLEIIPVNLHAKSRGELKLESDDPLAHPYIQSNDLKHPDDVKVLIQGTRVALRLVQAPVMKKYNLTMINERESYCDKLEYNSDEYWGCAIRYDTRTENHQAGSCKMGTDELAVVDQRLRVYGVKNVRVIDAASMPLMVSGNPSAAITMMAEKGCDFIKEDYGIIDREYLDSSHYSVVRSK